MSLEIIQLGSEKEHKQFIDFPHSLYKGDKNYVPEIYMGQKELLSKKKNPFFEHSEVALWLAKSNGKIVGRIAAVANNNYNDFHKSNVGFFGFFDVINDSNVAKSLLTTAKIWLKNKNFDSVLGPTNFSTNDTAGLLVNGFESPPVVMMTYNKDYYESFLLENGFQKEMDLFAYNIETKKVSEKSLRIASMLEKRLENKGIHVRSIQMKNFDEEVKAVKEVYNSAWENNWGFVPATDKEFDHLAEGLKLIINPAFTYLAENEQGKIIGFMLAIPDINEIMINVSKGRLFPFGLIKLLLGKNKTKCVRIITLGVVEGYRKLGIEGVFYSKIIAAAKRLGIERGEASWILENNDLMNKAIENLNGERYKTYRIFKANLH